MTRILIVEDEVFVALDIEHILMESGLRVCGVAHDRKSAMALADDCDIALIDVNLHDGTTGPSIAVDLASGHGVKIIFITSHPWLIGDAGHVAWGIITKPFRPETIIDMVTSAMNDDKRDDLARHFRPHPPVQGIQQRT